MPSKFAQSVWISMMALVGHAPLPAGRGWHWGCKVNGHERARGDDWAYCNARGGHAAAAGVDDLGPDSGGVEVWFVVVDRVDGRREPVVAPFAGFLPRRWVRRSDSFRDGSASDSEDAFDLVGIRTKQRLGPVQADSAMLDIDIGRIMGWDYGRIDRQTGATAGLLSRRWLVNEAWNLVDESAGCGKWRACVGGCDDGSEGSDAVDHTAAW
ncbi:hypothetical protein [Dactylosporangium sp. NPDC048998]|uniref:hypothetical protein n=1 Tax=Dactylosporangium sp. NPDC048998 TaxID=3363976 RepID=UPI00371B70E5